MFSIKDLMSAVSEATKMKSKLKKVSVCGVSKRGDVEICIRGDRFVESVKISESIVGNLPELEKQVKEALNDGFDKLTREITSLIGVNLF